MITVNYDEIGNFIAVLRKEKNLTQKDLAEKLGVTDKAVSKWERGLGCPDVSLLEALSKILNVSILELLKGRKIEGGELRRTNVEDLIVETVSFSKKEMDKKYKHILSNILSFIILVIVGFLITVNVAHISYLNQKIEYYPNNLLIQKVNANLNLFLDDINLIRTASNVFSENDKQKIIKHLEGLYEDVFNSKILTLNKKQEIKLKDLYNMSKNSALMSDMVNIYGILSKYDENMELMLELTKSNFINQAYLNHNMYNDSSNAYKYGIAIENNIFDIENDIYELLYLSNSCRLLSQNVIEVGDINE